MRASPLLLLATLCGVAYTQTTTERPIENAENTENFKESTAQIENTQQGKEGSTSNARSTSEDTGQSTAQGTGDVQRNDSTSTFSDVTKARLAVCPPVPCNVTPKCPEGVKRINGCPTCECNTPAGSCPRLPCLHRPRCRYGVATYKGCPTCSCLRPQMRMPFSRGPVCPYTDCMLRKNCKYGYWRLSGCPSCACRCPVRRCRRRCRYGRRFIGGCPSCRCNRRRCRFSYLNVSLPNINHSIMKMERKYTGRVGSNHTGQVKK